MDMPRAAGQGSITEIGTGRHWARLPESHGRRSVGVFPTAELAREGLDAALEALIARQADLETDLCFRRFGRRVLDQRAEDGVRGIGQELNRWDVHLADCALADRHVADIQAIDIVALIRALSQKKAQDRRGERKISRKTVDRCMAIVNAVFNEAIILGHRPDNPCVGVKIRRKGDEEATKEKWAFLTLEDQNAVKACKDIPEWARLMMQFAWATGLRQGEMWNLHLADLHTDGDTPHVFVRFGSKGKPPKNGKTRRVPLFGDGMEAARRWLEILPTFAPANPERLVFPGPTGARRASGAPERSRKIDGKVRKVELLGEWLRAAGVTKHLRWHDLRHTCASSLVGGFWGRRWSLEETKEMLGHSSINVTQMYAHLGETTLQRAAKETNGGGSSGGAPAAPPGYGPVTRAAIHQAEIVPFGNDFAGVGRPGLEPGTYGLKEQGQPEGYRAVIPQHNQRVTALARTVLELASAGLGPQALAIAVTLSQELLLGGQGQAAAPVALLEARSA